MTPLVYVLFWLFVGWWWYPAWWCVLGLWLFLKYSVIFLFYWMPLGIYRIYAYLFRLIVKREEEN